MLVMLYGTSCVGKSEIIKGLVHSNNYIPIKCYTTRGARVNDFARVSISLEEFLSRRDNDEFGVINEYLSCYYANLKEDLLEAVEDPKQVYILDFLIKDYIKVSSFKHKKIVIIPESENQLIWQIESSKRTERRDEILLDYRQNYNEDKILDYINDGFDIIANKYNCIFQTLNDVNSVVIR